jgi:hypothetical protein
MAREARLMCGKFKKLHLIEKLTRIAEGQQRCGLANFRYRENGNARPKKHLHIPCLDSIDALKQLECNKAFCHARKSLTTACERRLDASISRIASGKEIAIEKSPAERICDPCEEVEFLNGN